jgi:hypothetical protein
MQFYPGDWLKDPDLRRCSHNAKGVWIDALCLAFEGSQRGVFATADVPWSLDEIGCAIGGNSDLTMQGLRELVTKGVMKQREDKTYYCKRMVEDEDRRQYERNKKANQRRRSDEDSEQYEDVPQNVPAMSPTSPAPVPALSPRSSSSSSREEKSSLSHTREPAQADPPLYPKSEEEVIAAGSMHGIPPDECRRYFLMRATDGWQTKFDGKGGVAMVPIRNWVLDLRKQFEYGNLKTNEKPTRNTTHGQPSSNYERSVLRAVKTGAV